MPELNLENYSDLIIGLLTLLVGLSIRDWATAFVKGARFIKHLIIYLKVLILNVCEKKEFPIQNKLQVKLIMEL